MGWVTLGSFGIFAAKRGCQQYCIHSTHCTRVMLASQNSSFSSDSCGMVEDPGTEWPGRFTPMKIYWFFFWVQIIEDELQSGKEYFLKWNLNPTSSCGSANNLMLGYTYSSLFLFWQAGFWFIVTFSSLPSSFPQLPLPPSYSPLPPSYFPPPSVFSSVFPFFHMHAYIRTHVLLKDNSSEHCLELHVPKIEIYLCKNQNLHLPFLPPFSVLPHLTTS